MIVTFDFNLAQDLFNSPQDYPVDFDMAWQWIGYARKDSAKRHFEKCGFIEGIDFHSFHQTVEREIGATQKEIIMLAVECFKQWAMMSNTDMGKQIRLYFLECEKIAKTQKHKIPGSYAEALMAAALAEQEKEILLAEQKLLKEENQYLSEAVDELFNYSSIIRIAKFNNVNEKLFDWHRLKAVSQTMGVEIKKVPCPRFVSKNLYSHDVWRVAYPGYNLPETTTLTISNHN
jgi:phage anti-repressor protein